MSPEIVEKALGWIAEEAMSVNRAAAALGVSVGHLCDTLNSAEYAERYARARELRAALLAERAMDVAADSSRDPQDRRVEVDTIKWFAARVDPKRWSESTRHEHTGAGGAPLSISWQTPGIGESK